MMRETKTLKGLFADPKPPRRKNFIRENVKSVRQLEKFLHTDDNNLKDARQPVLKTIKLLNKPKNVNGNHINDNKTSHEDKLGDNNENSVATLLDKQLTLESQEKREISAPVVSNKKRTVKKLTRPSVNGNSVKKHNKYKTHEESETMIGQKLKSRSVGNIADQNLKENISICESIISRSQGVQTLDSKDLESLYLEGVIRYPSALRKELENLNSDRGDVASEPNDTNKNDSENVIQDVNSSKTNKGSISLANKLVSQLGTNGPVSGYHRIGVVPKYIKERKEALHKEQLAKMAAKKSDCPKGHVPLPDSERKETLSILKKNYQEYVHELNMLPIRTDTLRSQNRKMEIERQLAKLEEAIKVFSRPKVFVKVDS